MINYIEYLNLPAIVAIGIVAFLLIANIIGEILELKGKVVPEFIKIRKYFIRKKKERETLKQIPVMLKEFQTTLDEFKSHYNSDNISKRDNWMQEVNHKLAHNDTCIKELDKKLDKNNDDTMSLIIDNKRNTIINFASYVIDEKNPVTREQFNRIFKIHKEYEDIIKENDMTNGEVDVAYRIITEAYESHMKHHTFIEDIRGYNT